MPDFTVRAIKASFMKLLNERPLNKITVKDIADDCGISRNSFYYHFEDVPALMRVLMKDALNDLTEKYPTMDTFKDCIRYSLEFTLKNKKAMMHVYNSTAREIFEKYLWETCEYCVATYIDKYFGSYGTDEETRRIVTAFYENLLYGHVSRWLYDGLVEDVLMIVAGIVAFLDPVSGAMSLASLTGTLLTIKGAAMIVQAIFADKYFRL